MCQCRGQGLLEIKCPYSQRDNHPQELVGKRGFYLKHDGLNKSHRYYTQVQGQIAICDKQFCDFVVWTKRGRSIQRIYKDAPFLEKLLQKLTTFYVEHLLPELMTHHLISSQVEKQDQPKLYCWCNKEEYGSMILCDSPSCKYEWFHFACVGIKERPDGPWFCSDCNQ